MLVRPGRNVWQQKYRPDRRKRRASERKGSRRSDNSDHWEIVCSRNLSVRNHSLHVNTGLTSPHLQVSYA